MKKYNLAILFFVAVVFSGCVSNSIRGDYRLDDNSPKGVLMGSVTYRGMLSRYSISYEGVNSNISGAVGAGSRTIFSVPNSRTKVSGAGGSGSVFALELDPGRYVFNGWSVSSSISVGEEDSFNIEVVVEPGKAIYLGSFQFNQTKSAGLVVSGADVFFTSEYERDLEVLVKAFPLVPNILTANAVEERTLISSAEVGRFEMLLKAVGGSL